MVEARAWQRMLSGRRLDLLDPSPLDVEIEDIALGLARVARWNGQTEGKWSFTVAQHSLLVEDLAGRFQPGIKKTWRLAALLHDAAEYVIGDMITPFKSAIGDDYKALERRLMVAVQLRFGLPAALPRDLNRLIKRADRAAAYLEATQLAGFTAAEAKHLFRPPRAMKQISLKPAPPAQVEKRFLARFGELYGRRRGS